MTIHVAYDDRLLGWRLGKNHPTNPERAKNAIHMLKQLGADLTVCPISNVHPVETIRRLTEVHSPAYVRRTLEGGYNDEWQGTRPDLAEVASLMFQGTVDMVRIMEVAGPGVYFSPQGAKHHAMWDQGSGFCVFNDFAWAALHLAQRGERVLYIDTDAHHGDGVEALTYGNTGVMTASIHDGTIFPGTGKVDAPNLHVWNWALEGGAGDFDLQESVEEALDIAGRNFNPTVVLFACGADGYVDDPLSSLEYTYAGYVRAARSIGEFAAKRRAPVLVGGAGGYLPQTHTPRVWATVVNEVANAFVVQESVEVI